MPDPTVCAILLTANRPAMARQAVECFRRQTYQNKRLLIWDSGTELCPELEAEDEGIYWVPVAQIGGKVPIGELRNSAIRFWTEYPILCHWDDDDYSAPQRIAEQVSLLQASGAQACGYNQMLFWRQNEPIWRLDETITQASETERAEISAVLGLGEAWLYTGSILGTSLCYWRTSWERKHFEAMNNGEDTRWLMGLKAQAVSSIPFVATPGCGEQERAVMAMRNEPFKPRMIARIHSGPSGNTSNAYNPQVMRAVEKQGGEWKRVSEWDDVCRRAFA